jgi:hypothetical protein
MDQKAMDQKGMDQKARGSKAHSGCHAAADADFGRPMR